MRIISKAIRRIRRKAQARVKSGEAACRYLYLNFGRYRLGALSHNKIVMFGPVFKTVEGHGGLHQMNDWCIAHGLPLPEVYKPVKEKKVAA